jgi:magnesium transporter
LHIAYSVTDGRLERLGPEAPLSEAIWIDLCQPQVEEAAAVQAALGVAVPTLADMEEIEISNRFYREGGIDYMTVILPGAQPDGGQTTGPVTFILTATQMLTVRHHAPPPFETFPARADRSSTGCGSHLHLFLGLAEEIVARLADLIEGTGRELDATVTMVLSGSEGTLQQEELEAALRSVGGQGEALARVRLGLLTVERMLGVFALWITDKEAAGGLKGFIKSLTRDIDALEVHADFLSGRVGLATDTTLGVISLAQNAIALEQNATSRILSVVAVLFLPPTLIASIFGMNFAWMPALAWAGGFPLAMGLMVGSAAGTWAFCRWQGWL